MVPVTQVRSSEGRHDEVDALPPQAEAVLEFATRWWRTAGARDEALRVELHLTPTRYFQILNRLIDDEQAVQRYPLLTERLRRQRDRSSAVGG